MLGLGRMVLTPLYQPMSPQMLILTREPYVHFLAMALYVEVLVLASMLEQLIVLTAGG